MELTSTGLYGHNSGIMGFMHTKRNIPTIMQTLRDAGTMKAMVEAAKINPKVAQRVNMFRYRAAEELYDLRNDPDCLNNLVNKAGFENELKKMQSRLHNWMKQTNDPLLKAFENRSSLEKLKSALIGIYGDNYTKAAERQPNVSKGNGKKNKKTNR